MYNSKTITREELVGLFDYTNLKPNATKADIIALAKEARDLHTAAVCVNPSRVKICRALLTGTGVKVGTVIGFPLGADTLEEKMDQARLSILEGAEELDYVLNIGELIDGNTAYIKREMEVMASICRKYKLVCKVIFENCYLTEEQIRTAAGIALETRPNFIKTSTGFGSGGAKAEDVAVMKEVVGDRIKVKAAGGIRDWETCAAMIDAGAERIGTSSAPAILAGYDAWKAAQG